MATGAQYILSERRGVLALGGVDARGFLQGLVTNDMNKVAENRAIYALLLTPQGRFLHDLFIAEFGDRLYLDCEAQRRADLIQRLKRYRLRAKVTIDDVSEDFAVAMLFGEESAARLDLPAETGSAHSFGQGIVFTDPRHAGLGTRAILPRTELTGAFEAAGFAPGDTADYEQLRLRFGVPDGSRDLPVEKALPMENCMDVLNGLDWDKGCYVGQELTARMKYRALVKKRLTPVRVEGPLPEPGASISRNDREVGEMRSGSDGLGLALLRVAALEEFESFVANDATLIPFEPEQ